MNVSVEEMMKEMMKEIILEKIESVELSGIPARSLREESISYLGQELGLSPAKLRGTYESALIEIEGNREVVCVFNTYFKLPLKSQD